MSDELFIKELDNKFIVHEHDDCFELETWTDGGVNMIITLNKDQKKDLHAQFRSYAYDFDVDEEIDRHREDERYKKVFSISSSLEDFMGYKRKLDQIVEDMNRSEYA